MFSVYETFFPFFSYHPCVEAMKWIGLRKLSSGNFILIGKSDTSMFPVCMRVQLICAAGCEENGGYVSRVCSFVCAPVLSQEITL